MKKFLKIFVLLLVIIIFYYLISKNTMCLTQPTQWKNRVTGNTVGSPCTHAPFPAFLYKEAPLVFPEMPKLQ